MKVLVIGGGGREHAIVYKLSQSKKVDKLYCAPGNAGITQLAECVPINATEIKKIVDFSKDKKIDLVFVAPDDPLALGLVNSLNDAGIKAFGPTKEASIIESSKSFSKELMKKYNIPTAKYEVFTDLELANKYIDKLSTPIVIKADGLALGKGVIIANTKIEAKNAVAMMLADEKFGDAGKTILIEEYLVGKELTVLAFTDGKTVKLMPNSRDHKKALDNDLGLNTGGMGAIVPGENLTSQEIENMNRLIFIPTIEAMKNEGRAFKGVIYFGLMLTSDGPKVIEYNARFGDPETQAILPLLKTDLVDIIEAVINGTLDKQEIKWEEMATCCVVAASGGYPTEYEKGFTITGIDKVAELVFHAGTTFKDNNTKKQIVTNGGRVLAVTAVSDNLDDAIRKAYIGIEKIYFEKMHYRKDIGRRK